jgi:hypothetical protein
MIQSVESIRTRSARTSDDGPNYIYLTLELCAQFRIYRHFFGLWIFNGQFFREPRAHFVKQVLRRLLRVRSGTHRVRATRQSIQTCPSRVRVKLGHVTSRDLLWKLGAHAFDLLSDTGLMLG